MKSSCRFGQSGIRQRPRVEVRGVVRREHEPALRREVLEAVVLQPKEAVQQPARRRRRRSCRGASASRGSSVLPCDEFVTFPRRRLTSALTCSPDMSKKLVIVESPAKAKTIAGYLGPGFVVESSIGHIRDLPERASDIPKEKRERYGALGVAIDDGFEPYYVVDPDKKRVVADLKRKLKDADELLLATDEDREGEAIAWHLLQELKPKVPTRRMVFHEITKGAIEDALANPRPVDEALVDSQETRRILDRLYGYEVSPVLWKKVMPRLSAGRVQSVATRLVVERERERMAFVSAAYWDIEGTFDPGQLHGAARVGSTATRVAQGRDFGSDGQLKSEARQLDRGGCARAGRPARRRRFRRFARSTRSRTRRRPAPPFMTSTLQQEASRKLRFTAQTTMRVAQRLYERGYITYMRTDSTTLSETALTAARTQARELYGDDYVPDCAAAVRPQGQERAGGPRGDPSRGRALPTPGRGARASSTATSRRCTSSSGCGPSPRRWPTRAGRPCRCGSARPSSTGEDAEFGVERHGDHLPRLPRRLRGGPRRRARRRRGAPAAAAARRRRREGALARAAGTRDLAAGAVHRADAREGTRGPRDRPPVHVRVDPRDDPRSRLRRQEGHGARADVPRLRGDAAARAALRAARRLRLHGAAWRTTSTASPQARSSASTG